MEILFRGKRKDGPEILIGDLNGINGKVFIFPRTEDAPLNSPDWFEVDPKTAGQFIGQFDKDKKKIFSGDIIKFEKEGKKPFVAKVVYDNTKAAFGLIGSLTTVPGIIRYFTDWDEIEVDLLPFITVIGNICENAEYQTLNKHSIFHFGKYKDKMLDEIPASYFLYLEKQDWFIESLKPRDLALKEYITANKESFVIEVGSEKKY